MDPKNQRGNHDAREEKRDEGSMGRRKSRWMEMMIAMTLRLSHTLVSSKDPLLNNGRALMTRLFWIA